MSIYGPPSPKPSDLMNFIYGKIGNKIQSKGFTVMINKMYCIVAEKYGEAGINVLVEYIESIACLKQFPTAINTCQTTNHNALEAYVHNRLICK